jgi:ABC-type nitrate/sulfonate/bicarbonate transport system substrate-binding protein
MQFGKVQGGVFSPPDTLRARQLGFRELLSHAKIGTRSQTSAVATTRRWAREHPELVERYVRAAVKGAHRLKTDREFAMRVIATYTRQTDPTLLEETYDFYKDQWGRDGFPSLEGIQKNIDVAAADIPEARTARPDQFVDLTFAQKIRSSGLIERLWGKN